MKPWQLLVIRLYMLTFGRSATLARLFRKGLELALVKGKGGKGYHASGGFFDLKDLE